MFVDSFFPSVAIIIFGHAHDEYRDRFIDSKVHMQDSLTPAHSEDGGRATASPRQQAEASPILLPIGVPFLFGRQAARGARRGRQQQQSGGRRGLWRMGQAGARGRGQGSEAEEAVRAAVTGAVVVAVAVADAHARSGAHAHGLAGRVEAGRRGPERTLRLVVLLMAVVMLMLVLLLLLLREAGGVAQAAQRGGRRRQVVPSRLSRPIGVPGRRGVNVFVAGAAAVHRGGRAEGRGSIGGGRLEGLGEVGSDVFVCVRERVRERERMYRTAVDLNVS